ncbi:StbB family protein [Caballeronia zhejiangensis]|uniref:StbB family protein n=1 Tax=Caballeronia zhejiangensis TaxID=871203 RepID=UPI001F523336|nr:StbB family protein [Caballeronia zhejiangensis]MCI1047059.1 StdB protein [Caballeronia zhejiangensis]
MKIAVLNYSGSVGKTVAAHHLLKPRMPEAAFFSVETINQSASDLGASEVSQLQGKKFGELLEALVLEEDAIVDVGASNIEAFFESMSRFSDSEREFDLYVIPVTPDQKAWQESLKTVEALFNIGVSAENVRLLPNRITTEPADEIPAIFNYVNKTGKARISENAYLFESEIYGYLAAKRMSFTELIDDGIDYRALAKSEADAEKAKDYARMYRWKKLAIPVRNNLDDAYTALVT